MLLFISQRLNAECLAPKVFTSTSSISISFSEVDVHQNSHLPSSQYVICRGRSSCFIHNFPPRAVCGIRVILWYPLERNCFSSPVIFPQYYRPRLNKVRAIFCMWRWIWEVSCRRCKRRADLVLTCAKRDSAEKGLGNELPTLGTVSLKRLSPVCETYRALKKVCKSC